jgi:WD40 repeat protein
VATLAARGCVTSVAFHPTAPLLATGSSDSTVKLWRLSSDNLSATCVATLAAHSIYVTSVAFHPTLPLLATGSHDRTVKLWNYIQLRPEWQAMGTEWSRVVHETGAKGPATQEFDKILEKIGSNKKQ